MRKVRIDKSEEMITVKRMINVKESLKIGNKESKESEESEKHDQSWKSEKVIKVRKVRGCRKVKS